LFTSSDGRNWSSQVFDSVSSPNPSLPSFSFQSDFTSGNGLWVLVGRSGYINLEILDTKTFGTIWTSTGGAWSRRVFNEGGSFNSCVFGNGRFLITGNPNLTSTDGFNWSPWNPPGTDKIVFGNGTFVGMQRFGGVFTSTNGLEWTAGSP